MCVPDMMCLAWTVSKILKGYENWMQITWLDQATPLLGINFSFLISIDLINNCTKFDACNFSHCRDTARKPENVQFWENVKNCCQATPPAAEGIFVQLLLSGTKIIGTRHVNSGFSNALPLRRRQGRSKIEILEILAPYSDILQISEIKVLCCVIQAEGHVCEKFAWDRLRWSGRSGW